MDLGIVIFPTDTTLDPIRLAREVEDRGFESLWFPEHSHIPTSRATPWGGRAGARPLPEKYWHTLDAFVSLGAVAAVTTTLRIGTAITLVAQRDPIWLAKEVATLDVISGGRFEFGVGFGWNREEMASHGVDASDRFGLVAEKLGVMRALWAEDEASFEGVRLTLEPSWAWPKPLQRPHPPIVVGTGAGPKGLDVVFGHADGWMPHWRTLPTTLAAFRAEADRRGLDPAAWELTVSGVGETLDDLALAAETGARRALFALDEAPPAEILATLDRLADLKERFG